MTTVVEKPTKKNGDRPPKPTTAAPLPPTPSPMPDTQVSAEELAVRHGIANYQRAIAERDELQKHLTNALQLITVNKIEIEGLKADAGVMRSRMESYQHERDAAVIENSMLRTKLETFNDALHALLVTFGFKGPKVRRADEINDTDWTGYVDRLAEIPHEPRPTKPAS